MLALEVTAQTPMPYVERADGPIVFCAGGSDPEGALETMAAWCGYLVKTRDWVFLAPKGLLAWRCIPPWATCRPFAEDGWKYLRNASLVVTMFGQMMYECLWWQTPVVAFARTASDAKAILRLQHVGVNPVPSDDLPLWPTMTQQRFCATVAAHMDEGMRHAMSTVSTGLLDGQGVARVADAILVLT